MSIRDLLLALLALPVAPPADAVLVLIAATV